MSTSKEHPEFYVIVHSVAKKANIGNMLRSACAFGVKQVVIVGQKKNVQYFGAQGTHRHVDMVFVDKLEQAVSYVKNKGCAIIGIEILDNAVSILDAPFEGNTAFILGNEGDGLSQAQMRICDKFVYIPQYGCGTASLNVTVAASIVFQHFATFANLPVTPFKEGKYFVETLVPKSGPDSQQDIELHKQRQLRKEESQQQPGLDGLFDSA